MCPMNTPPTPHVLSSEHPASSSANHAVSRRRRIWGSNSRASFALKLKKGASKSLILSINPPRCEIYKWEGAKPLPTELPFILWVLHQNSELKRSFGMSLVKSLFSSRSFQKVSMSSASGTRIPIPTIATGSLSNVIVHKYYLPFGYPSQNWHVCEERCFHFASHSPKPVMKTNKLYMKSSSYCLEALTSPDFVIRSL